MFPTQPDCVAIDEIYANPYQPRTLFDGASLNDLAASIRTHGIIQPLVIVANTDPNTAHYPYRLIDGERRLRAAQIAGLTEVPVNIRDAPENAQSEVEIALIANIQREGLTPADEARSYQRLHDEFGLTDEQIAQRVGKSRSTITNARRLLGLPDQILEQVGSGDTDLPLRYARKLIPLARLDAGTATTIAAEVAKADDSERQEAFNDEVDHLLQTRGKEISDLPFDLKWQPAGPIELEGATQNLPACAGCEAYLKLEYRTFCARPACLEAKLAAWTAHELKRLSKALGIPIATPGEKTQATPKKDGYVVVQPAQQALKLKHASLRLAAGGNSAHSKWENKQITGSDVVALRTTDPEGLAKALGLVIKPHAAAPTSPSAVKAAQVDHEARRKVFEAAVNTIQATVADLLPHLGKGLPDNVALLARLASLRNFMDMLGDKRTNAVESLLNADKRPAVAELKYYLLLAMLEEHLQDLDYDQPDPMAAREPINELAKDLKVKLPVKWDAALKPKTTEAETARPAAKAKAKK